MSHKTEILATKENVRLSQLEDSDILYKVNWSNRINGLTISNSTWVSEINSGIGIGNEAFTDSSASAQLNGQVGEYLVTNTVTLSDGQIMQFQFILRVNSKESFDNNGYGLYNYGYH